ncbi:hypothetical protein G7Z17_g1553 [Cylindrodendrum hubeiense]|uniref:Uncharacterized protein n=1 Tax=Cylindrodendrum hubeiense TaxID=595255 RepID=A0A9P5HFV4_9HYPO|nr:hypothetical protein G7Z17_g1553 [Cylindrodendrum hubeiense]
MAKKSLQQTAGKSMPSKTVKGNTLGPNSLSILSSDVNEDHNGVNIKNIESVSNIVFVIKPDEKSFLRQLMSQFADTAETTYPLDAPGPTPTPSGQNSTPALPSVPDVKNVKSGPVPFQVLSKKQYEDVKLFGRRICEFYRLAGKWLDSKLNVDLRDLVRSIERFPTTNENGEQLNIDLNPFLGHNSLIKDILEQLQAIRSKVNNPLGILMNQQESPVSRRRQKHSNPAPMKRKGRSKRWSNLPRERILNEIHRAVRAISDGNHINKFSELYASIKPPYMDPMQEQQVPAQKVLEQRGILTSASSSMLKCISTTCSAHHEHTIWLDLDAKVRDKETSPTATFHIAFGCPEEEGVSTSFRVDSVLEEPPTGSEPLPSTAPPPPIATAAALQLPTQFPLTPLGQVQHSGRQPKRRLTKGGREQDMEKHDDVIGGGVTKNQSLAPMTWPDSPMTGQRWGSLNQNLEREFCLGLYKQHFSDWYKLAARLRTPNWKYEILYPASNKVLKTPVLLRELFKPSNKDTPLALGFDATQKQHIARVMIQSFLDFSFTWWMPKCWNIENMFVCNMSGESKKLVLELILKARFPGKTQETPLNDGDRYPYFTPAEHDDMCIRLGIMLLEVVIADPDLQGHWEALQRPEKRDKARRCCDGTTDLGQQVAREVGPRYREVIEMCLKGSAQLNDERAMRNFRGEILETVRELQNKSHDGELTDLEMG